MSPPEQAEAEAREAPDALAELRMRQAMMSNIAVRAATVARERARNLDIPQRLVPRIMGEALIKTFAETAHAEHWTLKQVEGEFADYPAWLYRHIMRGVQMLETEARQGAAPPEPGG